MSAEAKPELRLEIAHLLLIDIVGYSTLLVNEQIETVQELNHIVRGTDTFQQAEKNDRLLRIPTGDGMALLFFASPEEPAKCALEVSRALQDHPEIRVRMGVHSGPINRTTDVNDRSNVAGAGINVAQRVMLCGDAGHILLSKHVADDLAQYRHWQPFLRDLGEYEVKHGLRLGIVSLCKDGLGNPALPEKLRRGRRWRADNKAAVRPVVASRTPTWFLAGGLVIAVAAVLISTVLVRRAGVATSNSMALLAPEKSVAVLPFENRSDDKNNAYFADGVQDEVLTRLAKIADLKVISRTSTQQYRSTPKNLRAIAQQLEVAHIVEGSVQKNGDAVRINVQLINAQSDRQVWGNSFDRKLTDILSVESEVARAIALQLQAKLNGQEQEMIAAAPTKNPEAYDAYLRGLACNLRPANSTANSLGAQKYLHEAVRLDPKFALAWALLSYVDARGYVSLRLQPTAALREEARHAADTALALQPNLGEAILAKGFYHYACLRDYDAAVRHFEQARVVLPNSSRIPEMLAYVARRRGQWQRSESYFNEAERLDPRNVSLLTQEAASGICLRRFADAQRKLDQILDIARDDVDTLATKAAIAQAEGDLPRASAILAPLHPGIEDNRALETQVYQAILEGRPQSMIPRLKELLGRPDPAFGYIIGEVRFWLGWAEHRAGDATAAQHTWEQARDELQLFLKDQPENFGAIAHLALTEMGLGDMKAALALSQRNAAVVPIEKDAVEGAQAIEVVARVAARMRDNDRAIAALRQLLSVPGEGVLASNMPLTPALLRLDPMFDQLRQDARFQQLISTAPPNESRR